MSSPQGISQPVNQWSGQHPPGLPANTGADEAEDGFSIRPMRLKVLYTFDDQNKTNCLARGSDVLQVKTVALDETASIGIVELKTCIEAVIQCSPELNNRLGGDYTIYAYDYSEYDNPLVGQGMLSKALAAASSYAPALQSEKLITGRVCKNILGIFNNGVKETLEVKLRLVPVPTIMQAEYVNTMEKYREMSNPIPSFIDQAEWGRFLQSNPNMAQTNSMNMNSGQMGNRFPSPALTTSSQQRGSMNLEVVNQLLSPSLPPQEISQDLVPQTSIIESGNEGKGAAATTAINKANKTSWPASRTAVKRPYRKRQPKVATSAAVGGNTSGYEEGTDGDDAPAPRKRAKTTQTHWNSKSSISTGTDSLRVTASTAGSIRLIRPVALGSAAPGNHLEEIPRPPTPLPNMSRQNATNGRQPRLSSLRRASSTSQTDGVPLVEPSVGPEDQIRYSIESVGPSPERYCSPAETSQEIGSSPPVLRTTSPTIQSSPPCPSSPCLPQMPRTDRNDSGFMSGSIDDLFGEDDEMIIFPDVGIIQGAISKKHSVVQTQSPAPETFEMFMVQPGPMELLPTKMKDFSQPRPPRARLNPKPRAGSVMSQDGQTPPPSSYAPQATPLPSRHGTPSRPHDFYPPPQGTQQVNPNDVPHSMEAYRTQADHWPRDSTPLLPDLQTSSIEQGSAYLPTIALSSQVQFEPRPVARTMARTASLGSLAAPAGDPLLPPSSLQRSQTWSEVPQLGTDSSVQQYMAPPVGMQYHMPGPSYPNTNDPNCNEFNSSRPVKKSAVRAKAAKSIEEGKMPTFCLNCGAIDTPTWRKAFQQDQEGVPGYHEYSDAPGRVTTVMVLTRDENDQPTSHKIIKKVLGPDDDKTKWNEFILCNPCGIWMSKYKTHRPQDQWDPNHPDHKSSKRKPSNRKSRKRIPVPMNQGTVHTSEANFPLSEAYFPQSEGNYPQLDGILEGNSPLDTIGVAVTQSAQQVLVKFRPMKKLNAMTSDAASAALRKALKSSPARWVGTQNSPIDVEEDDPDPTRRVLFPSPRKDGSPMVLGEVVTNAVYVAPDLQSPKDHVIEVAEAPDKENLPPTVSGEDHDHELLRLFEEEMARPTTPVQTSIAPNPFKTPTRPAPSHRPITRSVSRSVSKSLRSAKSPGRLLMLADRTPTRTPGSTARRRTPRHAASLFESPFTATINQMTSEANQHSPTRYGDGIDGIGLDFGNHLQSPALNHSSHQRRIDRNFDLQDFFSTDLAIPSSPPGLDGSIFNLYEDPTTMDNMDWSQFSELSANPHQTGQKAEEDVKIKAEALEDDDDDELSEEVNMVDGDKK